MTENRRWASRRRPSYASAFFGIFVFLCAVFIFATLLKFCFYIFSLPEDLEISAAVNNGAALVDVESQKECELFLGKIYVSNCGFATGFGSACLVEYNNNKYFVTAKHVIVGMNEQASSQAWYQYNGDMYLVLIQNKVFFYMPSQIYLNDDYDIAIMQADNSLKTDLILNDGCAINPRDKIVCYGYPLRIFAKSLGEIKKINDGCNEFIHDAFAHYGSSGGPVVRLSNGRKILIGITVARAFVDEEMPSYIKNDELFVRATSFKAAINTIRKARGILVLLRFAPTSARSIFINFPSRNRCPSKSTIVDLEGQQACSRHLLVHIIYWLFTKNNFDAKFIV